ncbi:hypothetical protein [Novosphingobium sp. 9]|uniref:hypothetical protein n=1 Tax=Novosphingobium sp. 9 TaxID=2025349 RepID=UPI0028CBA830|nr:hypothetical protein [Novosphingobium sp. 9]
MERGISGGMSVPVWSPRSSSLWQTVRGPVVASLLALGLAACSATGGGVQSTPRPSRGHEAPVRKPVVAPPRNPEFQRAPGLEGVIGATQGQLERQFGKPRLDVWDGDARKLQFTGNACVLDIYLYPTTQSREPLASYVDARRASDGKDVDRGACVAALRGR